MSSPLIEIDELSVSVLVDNEVDPMSRYATEGVEASNRFIEVGLMNGVNPPDRGGPDVKEMKMNMLCLGAHGLSLVITATRDGTSKTMLFDTGPEEQVWKLNAARLKPDLAAIDLIHLSHWHRDHSGGVLEAIRQIKAAKARRQTNPAPSDDDELIIDLHPDRPDYRGVNWPDGVVSLEADPSFDEIRAAGGFVSTNDAVHTVLDGRLLVSGFIPRETSYEKGLRLGLRFEKTTGKWVADELVADERFVMCNVRDKGLVVFTGCSHAGVVNVARHAMALAPGIPLFAIVGGFHLGDAEVAPKIPGDPLWVDRVAATVADLKNLDPKVLVPGHCSGWRVKQRIEAEMPGRLAPSTVGTKFRF